MPTALWATTASTGSTWGYTSTWSTTTASITTAITGYLIDTTTLGSPFRTYCWNPRMGDEPTRREPQPAQPNRRREASDRARQTLLSLLPPDEQRRYENGDGFTVRGSAGGEYRIRTTSHAMNVTRSWTDESGARRRQRLCAHPRMWVDSGDLPIEDAFVAQLLMLRYDEPGFLQIANVEDLEA